MYQARVGVGKHAQGMESQEHGRVVAAYQQLITELPALNRQLLLYILDLLAVFASKSAVNRMTAQNLAAIFQPGILSHPQHDMAPNEYLLSQDVLIFLIENQDNFLFGMPGTGINQAEKEAVTPQNSMRRANSVNSAAGSFRLRKASSKSSRDSRHRGSPGVTTPGTPGSPVPLSDGPRAVSGGLGRSNTVPSNHSPALTGHRFQQRASEVLKPGAVDAPPVMPVSSPEDLSPSRMAIPPASFPSATGELPRILQAAHNLDRTQADQAGSQPTPNTTRFALDSPASHPASVNSDSRERKTSNLFPKSPLFGPSDTLKPNGEQRQPRKLQKRRVPGSTNESAHSSQASFHAADDVLMQQSSLRTPSNLDDATNPFDLGASGPPATASNTESGQQSSAPTNRGLMPPPSPTTSLHSKTSATDASDLEGLDDPGLKEAKKRNRFRLSGLGRPSEPLAPPPSIGQLAGARRSDTSLGSNQPRKSYTGDSQQTQTADSFHTAPSSTVQGSRRESGDYAKGQSEEPKKEGFLTKWKAKLIQSKDERDAEKRAKSPPRLQSTESGSKSSLTAFAHEHFSPRGRSMDIGRPKENTAHMTSATASTESAAASGLAAVLAHGEVHAAPASTTSIATIPEHAVVDSSSQLLGNTTADGSTVGTALAPGIESEGRQTKAKHTVTVTATPTAQSNVEVHSDRQNGVTNTQNVSGLGAAQPRSPEPKTMTGASTDTSVGQSQAIVPLADPDNGQQNVSTDPARGTGIAHGSAHDEGKSVVNDSTGLSSKNSNQVVSL